ncbi:MAG TPA: hypothetical protein VGA89_01860 [Patescibacteria group bacterium]|jgi:hypothetical protein
MANDPAGPETKNSLLAQVHDFKTDWKKTGRAWISAKKVTKNEQHYINLFKKYRNKLNLY